MTALDLPPIASRLRDVASSPVREILALTARAGRDLVRRRPAGARAVRRAGPARRVRGRARGRAAGRSLQYSTTEGDPDLRAAIAARLTARGLPTEADELLITSGSQQALTLAAAVLIEPGDRVLVEEPSYLAALQAFALAGAVVVPVACDGDGLDPDAVAAAAAEHGARVLYTVPTFHNPTGRTLPLERRRALAAVAERHGLWLIEDDPYGELRYRGEPLPSLATLPGAEDRTLALSTLSKVAAPGCGSAGCARPSHCAGRSWWPSRPPTCTRRPSTRRPPRAGSPPSTSTRTSACCAPSTAAAATR